MLDGSLKIQSMDEESVSILQKKEDLSKDNQNTKCKNSNSYFQI